MNLKPFLARQHCLLGTILKPVRNSPWFRFENNLKLHLGSGNLRLRDYLIGVTLFLPSVDLVANIKSLLTHEPFGIPFSLNVVAKK